MIDKLFLLSVLYEFLLFLVLLVNIFYPLTFLPIKGFSITGVIVGVFILFVALTYRSIGDP